MDSDNAVAVIVVLKTGHKMSFGCFSFEKVNGGYSFTTYPEQRGHKTIKIVKDDSIASIEITAPEHMLREIEMPAMAPSYPAGDPQRTQSGPQTHMSLRAGARPVQGVGPMSVVKTFEKDGSEREMVVNAGMIGAGGMPGA